MEDTLVMGQSLQRYLIFQKRKEMEVKLVNGEVNWGGGVGGMKCMCKEGHGVLSITCCLSAPIYYMNMQWKRYNLKFQ